MRQAFASGCGIQQAFGMVDGLCQFVSRKAAKKVQGVGAANQHHLRKCVDDVEIKDCVLISLCGFA
jgi:non-ribosomal peptide synthetase component E (peptide arylation enzyme)